jgi:glycosyltransferase involved in cell wall biosynthesis
MKVCYFGTYRAEYSRNRIMIEGLRRNGIGVIECHETLWYGIEDRVQAVGGSWKRPRFWWRTLKTYLRLLRRFRQIRHNYDVMVVGYPGQFDIYLARILTWLQRKPLTWDIFMSIYLIAMERELERSGPFAVRMIGLAERLACRLPDLLIMDTQEYASWFEHTHGIAAARFHLVPTGADSTLFSPRDPNRESDGKFRVIYYGTFIPNHGVPTIVNAAKLLADDEDITFELIGTGPERAKVEQLVKRYDLSNITFTDWLDTDALLARIDRADLCLGVFGTTPQSLMTVQNKIYEGLAMAKPVLTGDGPSVRSTLTHGEHVYLCQRADPVALAEAIQKLKLDDTLREYLADRGHDYFLSHFTVEQLGKRFADSLRSLTRSS